MRKLKIAEHISLDGVIEAGPPFIYGDWSGPYRTPEGRDMLVQAYGGTFDLLLGRKTYDMFSTFWPKAPSNPMTDALNKAKKYVVTHRPEGLAWGPSEAVVPDVVENIRRIKAQDGPGLVVTGSISLTSMLIEQGLADELLLLVDPLVLGKGKRIFTEGAPRSFVLESSKALPSGILVNTYKFDGLLKNKY